MSLPHPVKAVPRKGGRGRFPPRRGAGLLLAGLLLLAGCAGRTTGSGVFVSDYHAFRVRTVESGVWRRKADTEDILALNPPSASVLYYRNPHSGGVIALQVLARHYPGSGSFMEELRHIYRRMMGTPHYEMRTVAGGKYVPFERGVRLSRRNGAERAEFLLRGAMGRRPSAEERERERRIYEESLPFGGPRTKEEFKEERARRYRLLTPKNRVRYRGKVVVFLHGGRLYEFYYFNHERAFAAGLKTFDAFTDSIKFLPEGPLSWAGRTLRLPPLKGDAVFPRP